MYRGLVPSTLSTKQSFGGIRRCFAAAATTALVAAPPRPSLGVVAPLNYGCRSWPQGAPGPSRVNVQHIGFHPFAFRRHYVFIPTSWTELKMRWRQRTRPKPTVLRVVLQRYRRKFRQRILPRIRQGRLGVATRAKWRHTRRRWMLHSQHYYFKTARNLQIRHARHPRSPSSSLSSSSLHDRTKAWLLSKWYVPQEVWKRSKTLLRQRPWFRRLAAPSAAVTSGAPLWGLPAHPQQEVQMVKIRHAVDDPAWFDVLGRPHVARDATGRFCNPWISQSADGVKPLSVLWNWRKQRFRREWQEFWCNHRDWWSRWWRRWAYSFSSLSSSSPRDRKPEIPDTISNNPLPTTTTNCNAPSFLPPPSPSTLRYTWIGHSTSLVQHGGDVTLLTDPIFSDRASPFPVPPVGVGRTLPPACTIDDLPKHIDLVLISHDHYDHLDKASVRTLNDRGVGLWIVPLGTQAWMTTKADVPVHRVVEMGWWESIHLVRRRQNDKDSWHVQTRHSLRASPHDVHPAADPASWSSSNDENFNASNIWITAFPVQHWGSRTMWDRNYRLWASYAVLFGPPTQPQSSHCFYFTGDTAWPADDFPLFDQIRSYLSPWGTISLAAIPIGAYEPASLNKDSHVNPPEAVRIHRTLQSQQSVAIHHGSFPLSEEPLEEPAQWLQKATKAASLPPNEFVAIPHGTAVECPPPVRV